MKDHRDVVIIGAGAAGLTAGIMLSRARSNVLVIDGGEPRNAPAAHMHGFISRDRMNPGAFLEIGREELVRYGGTLAHARVVAARADGGGYAITTDSGTAVHARAVLAATGLTDELPVIPGVRELWGSSVHHCPHCHGYEVRDRNLAVIGGASPGLTLHQAALLRRYSDSVTLFTHCTHVSGADRERLRAFGVRVLDGTVTRLIHKGDMLVGVECGVALGAEAPVTAVAWIGAGLAVAAIPFVVAERGMTAAVAAPASEGETPVRTG